MNSLKYELRMMFDRQNPGLSYSSSLDEGTLENIINLSALNPNIFSNRFWDILAVKTEISKRKLFELSNKQHIILFSDVILIITGNYSEGVSFEDSVNTRQTDSRLLEISVMYSAKYYGIDSQVIAIPDPGILKREFDIHSNKEILLVMCLGQFNNFYAQPLNSSRQSFSKAVTLM